MVDNSEALEDIKYINGVSDRLQDKDFVINAEIPNLVFIYNGDALWLKKWYQDPETKLWVIELED